jgi:hypothetical protein
VLAGDGLEDVRASWRELDRVRACVDDGVHGLPDVFYSTEERAFIKEPVIDRNIETASIGGEQSIQARD